MENNLHGEHCDWLLHSDMFHVLLRTRALMNITIHKSCDVDPSLLTHSSHLELVSCHNKAI